MVRRTSSFFISAPLLLMFTMAAAAQERPRVYFSSRVGSGIVSSNDNYIQERIGIGAGVELGESRQWSIEATLLKPFSNESLPATDPYAGGIQRLLFTPFVGYALLPDLLSVKVGAGLSYLSGSNEFMDAKLKPTYSAAVQGHLATLERFDLSTEIGFEHTGTATTAIWPNSQIATGVACSLVLQGNSCIRGPGVIPNANSYSADIVVSFR